MVDASVNVALRIRPLVETEIEKGCQTCVATVRGQPQVQVLGTDKAFTFNHVFPPEVNQETFYNTSVKGMINNLFQGKNIKDLQLLTLFNFSTYSYKTYISQPCQFVSPSYFASLIPDFLLQNHLLAAVLWH